MKLFVKILQVLSLVLVFITAKYGIILQRTGRGASLFFLSMIIGFALMFAIWKLSKKYPKLFGTLSIWVFLLTFPIMTFGMSSGKKVTMGIDPHTGNYKYDPKGSNPKGKVDWNNPSDIQKIKEEYYKQSGSDGKGKGGW